MVYSFCQLAYSDWLIQYVDIDYINSTVGLHQIALKIIELFCFVALLQLQLTYNVPMLRFQAIPIRAVNCG